MRPAPWHGEHNLRGEWRQGPPATLWVQDQTSPGDSPFSSSTDKGSWKPILDTKSPFGTTTEELLAAL
eukprot:9148519-Pyramimonas_sp.AAC.1